MIAASDPQEFVPRGRQQVARHPGPLEPLFKKDRDFDEYIQSGLEKVSLSEEKLTEFWTLRKACEFDIKIKNDETNYKSNLDQKSVTPSTSSTSHIMNCTDILEDTASFKTSEGSLHQNLINKRLSDVSNPRSKRTSAGEKSQCVPSVPVLDMKNVRSKINPGFMEDELYVKGHTAVWSRGLFNNSDQQDNGRTVICSYTIPSPIKQALWVTFHCERPVFESSVLQIQENKENIGIPTPAICLVDKTNIRVFIIKGEQFVIPMPFQIERVWDSKYGIIIEKSLQGNNEDKYNSDYAGSIFTLAYPLDDVCPIAVSQNTTITRLLHSNYKIVYTCNNPSICLIFDINTKEHSVYKIRKVRQDEKDYGENASVSHSVTYNSQKLKNRLSIWDNLMTTSHLVTPSPIGKKRLPNEKPLYQQHKSKSFCSMAAISRCQSPTANESPWTIQTSTKEKSYLPDKDFTPPKSFFNCSKSMSHLRSTPNVCLEYIWSDTYSSQDALTGGPATSVFLSKDMIGQWFLCYILPSKFQLSIVKVDFSDSSISFGMVTSISAKDAINVPHLNMLAILEHSGNVTVYSGLTIVGKLHIAGTLLQHTPSPCLRRNMRSPFPRRSSLLPLSKQSEPKFDEHLLSPVLPSTIQPNFLPTAGNPTPLRYAFQDRFEKKAALVSLSDAIENRITFKYSDGTFYRVTLPIISHSVLVEHCINSLRQCLPKDAALVFSCRWYSTRNAIGNDDLDTKQEWELFCNLLLELLGYEEEHASDKLETPASAVKRPKTIPSSTDEDWFALLCSGHKELSDEVSHVLKKSFTKQLSDSTTQNQKTTVNPKSILFPYIRYIHFTLHLLYEDFKLNTLFTEFLTPLAIFLSKISNDLGLTEFVLHYWKDFPACIVLKEPVIDDTISKSIFVWQALGNKPISVMGHIYGLLRGFTLSPYPYFSNVNNRSRDIVQLCGLLAEANTSSTQVSPGSFIKDISGNLNENFQQKDHLSEDKVIEQIVLIMVEMKIDKSYIDTLPIGIAFLLYNALWKCRENPPSDWPVEAYHLLWRDDLVFQAQKIEVENDNLFQEKVNICFQLQESMPSTKQEIADLDGMEDIDCSLTKMIFSEDIRVLEARKMLASSKPVPITLVQRSIVSDHDFIEEQEKHLYSICIRTMALPVGRGMITLRTATPIITEPLATPTLCLTGKALPRGNTVELNHIDTPANMNLWPLFHNGVANGLRITPDAQNIDSTWIIFNKPKGGAEPQMEHAGFLMALGLNGHLKNLAILNKFDYFWKLHDMTSVGILLGLSAAFRATCNQSLTKVLAIHVEALLPPTSMEFEVSQNLQVAGLLGIGLVYQGSAHRHITEVLLSEIGRPPGPEMENSIDRESYSLAAGLALGLVMLKHGDQPAGMSDLNVPDTLHYYMVGGNKRPLTGSQKDKYKTPSFQIREGSSVNLGVTAPGATLALGMMYLGTGNKAVADWMALPETQYLLDFVRPDFLMLRSLSKSLILWDDIQPSKKWVESLVPASIRSYCRAPPTVPDVDYEAMNQAYFNIIAGACFALGLKYAGSGDKDAFDTLLRYCHIFTSLTTKIIAELAGKATIETCLNVLLISASMVMAGTGNLEIMRFVRHLRKRVGASINGIVTYGSQLAIHMALGLLFLGGGRYTLSNSPSSVAALICAFYPKFPTHSNDNKYHLQAFRHLYVLAVEPRLLIPKDVLNEEICYAKLKMVKLDGTQVEIKGPGLIPDPSLLSKVILDDERYWPVVFERGRNWDLLLKILSTTGYIEVKQRAGCLSYITDKFGYRSELARTLTQSKIVPWDPPSNSVINFTSDESVRNFCESVLNVDNTKASYRERKMVQLLTRMTYDAVVRDKIMLINIMVGLLKVILALESDPSTINLWQLKILSCQVLSQSPIPSLVSKETVLALNMEIDNIFDQHRDVFKRELQLYSVGGEFNPETALLAAYIVFHDIPHDLTGLNRPDNFLKGMVDVRKKTGSCEIAEKILETWMT